MQAVKRAECYPIAPTPATPSLAAILRQRIASEGPLPFADFMAVALYDPESGYYAREPRQVGRGGDFFTSVSVGPLFGHLLAHRFLREWTESGSPSRWRILECGAHDGTLAADILGTMERLAPAAFAALEYAIPEPLPRLQAAQRETLARFAGHTRFISLAEELAATPLPGVAFGNELLDALPFHVVEWRGGTWHECRVTTAGEDLVWDAGFPITDEALATALEALGTRLPEGYRTEIRTNFHDFLKPLTAAMPSGLFVWFDYGFARPEYYHPDRTSGTLRTFSRHRAAENPLASPGEIDITAHVDFTAAAEAAMALGCQPAGFQAQGPWLTGIARDWLLSLEGHPDPVALRQFQTLTHPAHLGGSFHVLELSWNQPGKSPSAAVLHRLALSACPPPGRR